MRIFQTFEAAANSAVPASRAWHRNLHLPLVEMGHEVVLLPAAKGGRALREKDSSLRAEFSRELLTTFFAEHRRKPFDLFFAYLMDDMVEPAVLDEVRRAGVPVCNFSCNNIHQFDLADGLATHVDLNLHAEKAAGEKFRAICAPAFWWPMAANPSFYHPVDVPRTVDASFVGANYALRARYVAHLLAQGVDAQVYGPDWVAGPRATLRHARYLWRAAAARTPEQRGTASARLAEVDFRHLLAGRYPDNLHPPVTDEEQVALYSRSRISLGFVEVYDRHDPTRSVLRHLHLRDFEAPLCGALYCTGYTAELAEMFEPDREVLVYRNEAELLDKVRHYLAHPDEAEPIRQAGLARALRDHTMQKRFRDLFARLELKTGAAEN